MEEAVLGAILLESNRCDDVLELITDSEVFYKNEHQEIFQSILNLKNKGQNVDTLTVMEDLTARSKIEQIGGAFTIASLTSRVTSTANAIPHSQILLEKWLVRQTIALCQSCLKSALKSDINIFQLLEQINNGIDNISFKNIKKDLTPINQAIFPALEEIEAERKSEGLLGVTTGLQTIDEHMNGWKSPNLIILAARPSVGKTALALNFAHAGSIDKPVAFFSYEMGNEELVKRLLSIDTQVNYSEIQVPTNMGEANWKRLQQVQGLEKRKIFMTDDRSVSTSQMLAMCRRLKKKQGLGLIIVDYLQLMPEDKKAGNREQQIAKISRDLKGIAKDLKVPVIALSQMSREIEKGIAREPNLSDLRESGAIEQDADIVFFLYGATEPEIKEDANKADEAYLKIAKYRGGEKKKLLLYKDLSTQRFLDKSPFDNQQFNPSAGIQQDYNREPEKWEIKSKDMPF